MQQATRVVAMLLVSLFMQSCAMQRCQWRFQSSVPGRHWRFNYQMIAWTHAECYLTLKPTSFEDVKETISRCKKQLLEGLS